MTSPLVDRVPRRLLYAIGLSVGGAAAVIEVTLGFKAEECGILLFVSQYRMKDSESLQSIAKRE